MLCFDAVLFADDINYLNRILIKYLQNGILHILPDAQSLSS